MGREVRRVPPNWDHPKSSESWRAEREDLQPMHDRQYSVAREEWIAGLVAWKPEEHDGLDYWEYEGGPPDREYYRPWKDEEATWFQLWETVSEGTPVSPPFATKEELAQYLAEHGDFWDDKPGKGGWGIERARAFVASGWAPSFIITDGGLFEGTEMPLATAEPAASREAADGPADGAPDPQGVRQKDIEKPEYITHAKQQYPEPVSAQVIPRSSSGRPSRKRQKARREAK